MRDEIKAASYRQLTSREIDFYMRRGRRLRSEAAYSGVCWLFRKARGGLMRLHAVWPPPSLGRRPRLSAVERAGGPMANLD